MIVAPYSSSRARRSGRRVGRHDARQLQSLQLGDERERDAGVAARRLEQFLPGLQIGGLDHRQRNAVLDRAGRVLSFELRVDRPPRRRERLELDQRGVPDQVEQRASNHSRPPSPAARMTVSSFRAPACRGRRVSARPRRRRRRSRTTGSPRRRRRASRAPGSVRTRSSSSSRTVEPDASTSRAPPASRAQHRRNPDDAHLAGHLAQNST